MRRVHHFEMELRGVELARIVADDGDRRIRRAAEHLEALRQFGHPVAVAHPDRIFFALAPHAFEDRAVGGDLDLGAAEFAVMAAFDLAAELRRHRLLAVADAEHRHAGLVDRLGRQRRVFVEHRGRPAGQDHRLRLHLAEGGLRLLIRHDLAIDLLLAHPPRDELGDLRAEIDDEDFVVRDLVVHGRLCAPNVAGIRAAQSRSGRLFAGNAASGLRSSTPDCDS